MGQRGKAEAGVGHSRFQGVVSQGEGGGLGDGARGRLDPALGRARARVSGSVFMLGALGSHSMILSRRLTWAERHFGRDQLMAELKTLSRPCGTGIFIDYIFFPFK